MVLSNRAEEILEALWVELVEGNKQSCEAGILKDNEALEELIKANFVELKDNMIKLTPAGREEARGCVRRHRLAERLFVDVFDVKKTAAHEPSCRFEHLLHKGLDENVCTLLGHPKVCPHGRPIPEGECCKKAKKAPEKIVMPLSDLKKGQRAKIAYIHTHDSQALQKILAMGALPNAHITLVQSFPSYVFKIGKSQFAIDKELAGHIYLRI